jgi:hypothetical protein
MRTAYRILIMGASYGSLLATKLLLAGHTVKLACLPAEADLINREGTRVRLPVKGHDGLVEIDSRQLPGKLSADAPAAIDPAAFDLGPWRCRSRNIDRPACANCWTGWRRPKFPACRS